jgi:hypothetical protein
MIVLPRVDGKRYAKANPDQELKPSPQPPPGPLGDCDGGNFGDASSALMLI